MSQGRLVELDILERVGPNLVQQTNQRCRKGQSLKTGKVLKRFTAKDGRNVVLRTPRWGDLDDLLELINSLVDEKAEIYVTQKFTREAEANWLLEVLSRLKKDEQFFLAAEVDAKVVALSDFQVKDGDDENRVAAFGIIVRDGYRNLGIGTEIMKTLLEQAASFGLRSVTVNAFATNRRAIHVYEKVGFFQTGRIPKKHYRHGIFIDELTMAKSLDKNFLGQQLLPKNQTPYGEEQC